MHTNQPIYTIGTASKMLGVAYHRVRYAILRNVVKSIQMERGYLLTQQDIETLRTHFGEAIAK